MAAAAWRSGLADLPCIHGNTALSRRTATCSGIYLWIATLGWITLSDVDSGFDIWQILAGLGLFLFGMHQLEDALTRLAGRSFKRFLRSHTTPPIRGVIAGALSAAALQSSSVVGLIVLAFVATGIVSLAGALGIVFGANLGTTATGWIVATVGFRLDLASIALPLIAAGGTGVALSRSNLRFASLCRLVLGFGLMLLALSFMKDGVASVSQLLDPAALAGQPLFAYLLVGLIVTAIVQSSSATIMVALSALYAGLLPLPAAVCIAIGADLGSTTTSLLGAVAGSESKKRVATGLLIFNLFNTSIAFALLPYLLEFIGSVLQVRDPLYMLVAFHSLYNVIGVTLFLPLITPLSRQLERLFHNSHGRLLRHIEPEDTSLPTASLENVQRETARLLDQVAAINQVAFELRPVHSFYTSPEDRAHVQVFGSAADADIGYADAKELEGAILDYCVNLQEVELSEAESNRLSQLISSNRNAIYAAKCIHDTAHDLHQLKQSENDAFHAYAMRFRECVEAFYADLDNLRIVMPATVAFETLVQLKNRNEELHTQMHENIFDEIRADLLARFETSVLLNVNRQIYNSHQGLLSALANLLLDAQSAVSFAAIPTTR